MYTLDTIRVFKCYALECRINLLIFEQTHCNASLDADYEEMLDIYMSPGTIYYRVNVLTAFPDNGYVLYSIYRKLYIIKCPKLEPDHCTIYTMYNIH